MSLQIVLKAGGNIVSLWDDLYTRGYVLQYLVHEQGIVRTTEDDGVHLRVQGKQFVYFLFDKIVGTGHVRLVVFNQRYPHRACNARYLDVGMQFGYFQIIGA